MRIWFGICLAVGGCGGALLAIMGYGSTPGGAMPIGGLLLWTAPVWLLFWLLVGLI